MAIEHWDPVGVYDDASHADVYDPYLERVGRMLRQGKGPDAIAQLPRRRADEGVQARRERDGGRAVRGPRRRLVLARVAVLGGSDAGGEQDGREREARGRGGDRGLGQRGGGSRRSDGSDDQGVRDAAGGAASLPRR